MIAMIKNKFPFKRISRECVDLINLQCLLGGDVNLYKLPHDKKYALVTLSSNEESFSALVDIATYCQNSLLDFSFISWCDIPYNYFIELFTDLVSECYFFDGHFKITDVLKYNIPVHNEPWCYIKEEKLNELFVKTVPAILYNKNREINYNNLTVIAKYFLGKTIITFRSLSSLEPGDVILIKKPEFKVFFGDNFWSSYSFADEGVFMSDMLYEIDNNEESESIELSEQVGEKFINRDKISIEISFLLDKKKISLLDFTAMTKGSILPLNTGCENKIKIYINDSLWGYGALIYIEENLAVEVSQIVSPIILE